MTRYLLLGIWMLLSCATYAQEKIKVACVGNRDSKRRLFGR